MAWTLRVFVWGCLVAAAALPTARAQDAQTTLKASQPARGEEAFKNALARLGSPQASERSAAADELGRRGYRFRQQIAEALRPLLRKDPEPSVRAASGRALGRLGIRDAVPELTAALTDASSEVRAVAAAALWRLPDQSAVPALIEHTDDGDASVREWCTLALGATKDARAVAPLIERLTDPDRRVRLAAVRGLGRLDASEALTPLQGYLSTPRDEEEKDEVVNAVIAIDGSEGVACLLALYEIAGKDNGQKRRLLNALGRVGDAQALPLLRKLTSEKNDARELRTAAAAAYASVLARTGAADAGAK